MLNNIALLDLELLEQATYATVRYNLLLYKVFVHLTPGNPNDVFTVYSHDARSRLNLPYLENSIKATHRLLSVSFFSSVDAWNATPPALRSSSSLSAYKRSLRQFDRSA
jgi:hypothetical protein